MSKQTAILIFILCAVLITPVIMQESGIPVKEIAKNLLYVEKQEVRRAATPPQQQPQPSQQQDAFAQEIPAQDTPALEINAGNFAVSSLAQLPNHETASSISQQAAQAAQYEADLADIQSRITGLEELAKLSVPAAPVPVPQHQEEKKENVQVKGVPDLFDNTPFKSKVKWIAPPPGFQTGEAYNMMIYREKNPVTARIKTVLERVHGNLMLDLLPFTMTMQKYKMLIMLFGTRESYGDFTNRPPWSGASSDLQRDTLYVVEGDTFYPLSIHEMTHLYFDGFFLPSQAPLWLSEGMAVYMQSNTAQGKPEWVTRSIEEFKKGNIMDIEEFVQVESLKSYEDWQAELWYSQAYSLVEYMLNMRSRNEFYQFCINLKEGMPEHQALYRAYGLPFNKMETLQSVWLHDLQKKGAQKE